MLLGFVVGVATGIGCYALGFLLWMLIVEG